MSYKLICKCPGNPAQVLYIEGYPTPEPGPSEVLVQMLASVVNPVDINIIQGKYPLSVTDIGSEGVGKVIKLGTEVQKLKIGDTVVPLIYAGSWRTHLVADEDMLLSIPKEIGIAEGATFLVNPSTMYVILKHFVDLEPGDTVIQNGANSGCGMVAIQLCKIWGLKTVNVVRDRPDIDELKEYLKNLGATYVLTEEEIKTTNIFKTGEVDKPKLGMNCIGGESANSILRHIQDEGVLVTYGGMSLEPIRVSTTTLVFKNIRLEGFNINRWFSKSENDSKKQKMFKDLVDLMVNGNLKAPPHVFVNYQNYQEAIKNTLSKTGKVGKKYILDFRTQISKM